MPFFHRSLLLSLLLWHAPFARAELPPLVPSGSGEIQLTDDAPRASRARSSGRDDLSMKLSSPDFCAGGLLSSRFTADGANVNPSLRITGTPRAARSLVLIVDDPDATQAPGGLWNHWLLWNISPDTREIPSAMPPSHAVQGTNDFGRQAYGGPAPPSGVHHYHFRLYALKEPLFLPVSTKRAALEAAMEGKIIAQTELVGLYTRER